MITLISNKPSEIKQTQPLKTVTLDIEGMKCAGCVKAVERQLNNYPGVISACVNLITQVAVVKYEQDTIIPETLAEYLTERGFPTQARTSSQDRSILTLIERNERENQEQLKRLIISLILLFCSFLGHLHHLGGPSFGFLSNIWFHFTLATLALLIPGREILIEGFRSLWYKNPNMNTLIALGTLSAYCTSTIALLWPTLGWECFFDEPVMLLGFIFLGRTLEGRARNRANSALISLFSLQPDEANLVPNHNTTEATEIKIPVAQIKVGEWLKILPGEKIPIDGKIVAGQTSLDESLLTGESLPIFKQKGDIVSAGTINLSGLIIVEATRIGKDTTLNQIIAAVELAQTRKAPVQQLADTVAGYFAYMIMAIATLTLLFWYFQGTKIWPEILETSHNDMIMTTSPLLLSLKLSIAVLVIACPCALGLATPTAILVGTSKAAEQGILIKGGETLQQIHQLKTIVFDKTGTLTEGKPQVTDQLILTPEFPLIEIASTLENGTNHPLAAAILDHARKNGINPRKIPTIATNEGFGVKGEIDGKIALIGSENHLINHGVHIPEISQIEPWAKEGKTVVYVAFDRQLIGVLAVSDQVRKDAQETVKSLQNMGLNVILLSGDRQNTVDAIAQELGIKEYYSGVTPQEKANLIAELPQPCAMIGDGINDAVALKTANVGISLKNSTEVAIESADIVLMSGKLKDLIKALKLSLATYQKIQQNLGWALGYNLITIPLAAGLLLPKYGILLNPAVAAAFMASSSVIVVTNSLLLYNKSREN